MRCGRQIEPSATLDAARYRDCIFARACLDSSAGGSGTPVACYDHHLTSLYPFVGGAYAVRRALSRGESGRLATRLVLAVETFGRTSPKPPLRGERIDARRVRQKYCELAPFRGVCVRAQHRLIAPWYRSGIGLIARWYRPRTSHPLARTKLAHSQTRKGVPPTPVSGHPDRG